MLRNVMFLSRRKKLARLHKSTIAVSPDPLPSSEGLASETINVHLPTVRATAVLQLTSARFSVDGSF